MLKILIIIFVFGANADESFESWLSSYKKYAFNKGISQETIDIAFQNVKFLEQVIKYDRKQPEFFEDTKTYVSKRANISRAQKGKILLRKNKDLFSKHPVHGVHKEHLALYSRYSRLGIRRVFLVRTAHSSEQCKSVPCVQSVPFCATFWDFIYFRNL